MDVPLKCSLWRITLPLTRRVSFLAVSHAFHKAHFVSDEKNLHCSFSLSSVKLAEQLLTSSVTGEAGDVFLSKIFTWLPGNNPLWRFLPRAYRNKVISVRSHRCLQTFATQYNDVSMCAPVTRLPTIHLGVFSSPRSADQATETTVPRTLHCTLSSRWQFLQSQKMLFRFIPHTTCHKYWIATA